MLYGISDFFCFILYRCIGYRKKVVLGNLKMAFPEKSDSERNAIAREFYAHFCDLVVEAIKNFSARESELKKRFVN
jgi:KDO2-lipid IV(A) lauroyltransferase